MDYRQSASLPGSCLWPLTPGPLFQEADGKGNGGQYDGPQEGAAEVVVGEVEELTRDVGDREVTGQEEEGEGGGNQAGSETAGEGGEDDGGEEDEGRIDE